MNLIERYLNEVKFWLPGAQGADVVQELNEDLRSQIEDEESRLGRNLTDAEVGEILKKRGQPVLVAARYLPVQHVVGPNLFPFYLRTLQISLIGVAIAHVVMGVLMAFTESNPVVGFLGAVPRFVSSSILTVGLMTIVFGLIEYFQVTRAKLENWNPQLLPAVENKQRISRVCSAFELFFSLMFLSWWVGLSPTFHWFEKLPANAFTWMSLSIWKDFTTTYHLQILVLTLAGVILTCANLARPYWTKPRLGARALIDALISALLFMVVSPHWPMVKAQWIQMTGGHHGLPPSEVAAAWTAISISGSFLIAAISIAGSSVKSVIRMVRW